MSELQKRDPNMYDLIQKEKKRQISSLELIASENFTSKSVMECLGSVLTNKYSEGLPNARYYGGNEIIDQIENLCISRALKTYRLSDEEWGVNVQPYSGSVANMATYLGVLSPHDRIMGLDLPSGGHLTHGYYTSKKKISATSVVFESFGYRVNSDGYIDYEELESIAERFKPKMIICGASAYPREIDYKRFREIADKCGSLLLCDMAHISGLVATQEADNPFQYCDLVTTTTHKTLRGPRAGMIFFKKHFQQQINFSVFPGVQGGPHENQIAGVATQLLEAQTPEFKKYIIQVKKNAKAMAEQFIKLGYQLSTNGTDNHLILLILRNKNLTGSKVEKICEAVNISLNKNAVPGDKSALQPGGIRLGTPALTTRGFTESEFIIVANMVDEAVKLAIKIQNKVGKKLKDFCDEIEKDIDVKNLKEKVAFFAQEFPFESL